MQKIYDILLNKQINRFVSEKNITTQGNLLQTEMHATFSFEMLRLIFIMIEMKNTFKGIIKSYIWRKEMHIESIDIGYYLIISINSYSSTLAIDNKINDFHGIPPSMSEKSFFFLIIDKEIKINL